MQTYEATDRLRTPGEYYVTRPRHGSVRSAKPTVVISSELTAARVESVTKALRKWQRGMSATLNKVLR